MPDLVQPIIGFRMWTAENGLLRSSGAGNALWDPDVTVAECEGFDKVRALIPPSLAHLLDEPEVSREPHPAPKADCGCGLYAYHGPQALDGVAIFGAIAAWGRVEVHEVGFRAEKARIVALAIDDSCLYDKPRRELIERLAATYGAKAVPGYLLAEEARKHGIRCPKELLPEREPRSSRRAEDLATAKAQVRAYAASLGYPRSGYRSAASAHFTSFSQHYPGGVPVGMPRRKRLTSGELAEALVVAAFIVFGIVIVWLALLKIWDWVA